MSLTYVKSPKFSNSAILKLAFPKWKYAVKIIIMKTSSKNRGLKIGSLLKKINFGDLSLFETIARHGTLAGAARELGLRAPYVTKAIHRLEITLEF